MGVSSVEIGCRVHFEGEFGTVLYVGPIEGVDGTWLGVEWDNLTRGKHSGCYNNINYFQTSIPNAGSFIRQSKADLGISCPKAVRLKYGHEDASSVTPTYIYLPQKSGPERHVEMVGMKKIMGKQSNFHSLTNVVLSKMLINDPGEVNELKELIPNVRDLDLSQNLLSSWKSVNEIVEQLPSLDTLILSKNRLQIPESPEHLDCYKNVKTLVINDMAYDWRKILTCAMMWPDVENLSVKDNYISNLDCPLYSMLSNLSCLSLNNNCIISWSEICKLGILQSLKELQLDNIELCSIEFIAVSPLEKTELFRNLESLFVKNNWLKKWQDISELNKLISLKNLVVTNNPVLSLESPETCRQYIIAKIQNLERLSRTEVERSERRGAELDYIKKFYKDWLLDDCSKCEIHSKSTSPFLTLHPTYPELLKKHGIPDESEFKVKSTLIKDNLVFVQFFCPSSPSKPQLSKKLPAEMTIGKLKALVKRLFKVPSLEVKLSIISNDDTSQRTDLNNNLRQISFYSISDKDKIAVEW
ncbi:tubulin-specific chaperone E isoform X1 [Parasteatoda tepidariorum]|nr:tubulin-specific chaperone E [Parasteatoda tepidariorum]